MDRLNLTPPPESPEREAARLAWRAAHIPLSLGASEAPVAVGFSRFGTPLSLWSTKTGRIVKEREESGPMRWGNKLEDLVIRTMESDSGGSVRLVPDLKAVESFAVKERVENLGAFDFKEGNPQVLLSSRPHPWKLLSPDAFAEFEGDLCNVEAKTGGAWSAKDWGDEVPQEVSVQVFHGMAVTGIPKTLVPVLLGGQDFRVYVVELSDLGEDGQADLHAMEVAFLDQVARGVQPPVDLNRDFDTLKALHPNDTGDALELTKSQAAWVDEWREAVLDGRAAAERKKKSETALRAFLGGNTYGDAPDGKRITLKTQRTAGGGTTRVLRLKGAK